MITNSASIDFSKQAQAHYATTPVIILGSGASAAFGMPGMWDLSQHLIKHVDPSIVPPKDQEEWRKFCGLLDEGVDLETALHRVHLCEGLTNSVVKATWELLNPSDINVFNKSLNDNGLFPLGTLLRSMFRSTRKAVDVITTNYDRLAEYACEQEGLHHYTGFSHGYKRTLTDAEHLLSQRQVNIWKVHGSLDWYKSLEHVVCALPNLLEMPEGYEPMIVTPGAEKYRITHGEPFRTAITRSDRAIIGANSYLCIGFGFNDQHIQEKLIEGCIQHKKPVTVITYGLTEAAKEFLFNQGVINYLAIERGEHDDQSVIHSSLADKPLRVEQNLWSVAGYLGLIL
ncbi:SIR2 family protein [Neptunomonas qingdaonensis]|uniref:SIR2-like domain-containing protein n=1 Tax=Neptunomonas qingdaonensis TaxID=1045558 RepID=A0A1I2QQA5_9GAMM|nr:SIR2 family protein [Neptunomonas qingdaonensis]SFG29843.1 SIR2-like domain-containing protein [Neptunomonas qingdaonensis]